MIDIDMIKSAKYFVDGLANGKNPFSQDELPSEDIVNDVRAARWLFYLSQVLEEVIQNGGITASTAAVGGHSQKSEYFLTEEMRANFRFSKTPLLIGEISRRIIEIGPKENVKRFPKSKIVKWLVSIGLIEEIQLRSGKMGKRPSELGKEIGITQELRSSNGYYYYILLYNENAQHFIIDNIDAILAFDSKAYDKERAARLAAMRVSSSEGNALEDDTAKDDAAEDDTAGDDAAEHDAPVYDSSAEISASDRNEPRADTTAPDEGTATPASKDENANEASCLNCKFSRSGECFPQKNICSEFEPAYTVPADERDSWPDYGDASALRRGEKR